MQQNGWEICVILISSEIYSLFVTVQYNYLINIYTVYQFSTPKLIQAKIFFHLPTNSNKHPFSFIQLHNLFNVLLFSENFSDSLTVNIYSYFIHSFLLTSFVRFFPWTLLSWYIHPHVIILMLCLPLANIQLNSMTENRITV